MNINEQILLIINKLDKIEQEIEQLKSYQATIKPRQNKKNEQKITKTSENSSTGTKWMDTEDAQLINELKEGKTIAEIGVLHKRLRGGISARIRKHIRDANDKGDTVQKISNDFNLGEQYIQKIIK